MLLNTLFRLVNFVRRAALFCNVMDAKNRGILNTIQSVITTDISRREIVLNCSLDDAVNFSGILLILLQSRRGNCGFYCFNGLFADVNECGSPYTAQCELSTTVCTNTIGSYTCDCQAGHIRLSSTKCINTLQYECEFYFFRYNVQVNLI